MAGSLNPSLSGFLYFGCYSSLVLLVAGFLRFWPDFVTGSRRRVPGSQSGLQSPVSTLRFVDKGKSHLHSYLIVKVCSVAPRVG